MNIPPGHSLAAEAFAAGCQLFALGHLGHAAALLKIAARRGHPDASTVLARANGLQADLASIDFTGAATEAFLATLQGPEIDPGNDAMGADSAAEAALRDIGTTDDALRRLGAPSPVPPEDDDAAPVGDGPVPLAGAAGDAP